MFGLRLLAGSAAEPPDPRGLKPAARFTIREIQESRSGLSRNLRSLLGLGGPFPKDVHDLPLVANLGKVHAIDPMVHHQLNTRSVSEKGQYGYFGSSDIDGTLTPAPHQALWTRNMTLMCLIPDKLPLSPDAANGTRLATQQAKKGY